MVALCLIGNIPKLKMIINRCRCLEFKIEKTVLFHLRWLITERLYGHFFLFSSSYTPYVLLLRYITVLIMSWPYYKNIKFRIQICVIAQINHFLRWLNFILNTFVKNQYLSDFWALDSKTLWRHGLTIKISTLW